MNRRAVVSREYKVMLRAGKFAGTDKQLLGGARAMWDAFAESAAPIVLDVNGTLDTIERSGKRRETSRSDVGTPFLLTRPHVEKLYSETNGALMSSSNFVLASMFHPLIRLASAT